MNTDQYSNKITCAYLYSITKYGYPSDVRNTVQYIDEMKSMGFSSIELEAIGEANVEYMFKHYPLIAEQLTSANCSVPVFCIVLPKLGSAYSSEQAKSLELFDKGCITANQLGANAVLDNSPLLPLEYPKNAPIQRHYSSATLSRIGLPAGFDWNNYWLSLTNTFQKACAIAANYNLSYHLHPCEGSLITGTESFLNFASSVKSENLLFNLDTANQFYYKDNLPLSLLRLSKKVSYIHISDNRGNLVDHLVPGDGEIDRNSFFAMLRTIDFKGNFAIDVGGAETNIADIRQAYIRSANWLNEKLSAYALN
ncbi:sugar phosphate isomerase/epimerase family protein [Parafilimonas sp.]|uniref:sugar phosphate isomerase/epimerase family protein n=1 Tax=Parafilimonas sp. TaxID=1969739 RepID=UPI0039E53F2B